MLFKWDWNKSYGFFLSEYGNSTGFQYLIALLQVSLITVPLCLIELEKVLNVTGTETAHTHILTHFAMQ